MLKLNNPFVYEIDVFLLVFFCCLILIIQIWVAKLRQIIYYNTNMPKLFHLIYTLLIQQKRCRQVFTDTFFSSFFAYITIFLPDYHVFVIPGSNQQHNLHACPTGTYR